MSRSAQEQGFAHLLVFVAVLAASGLLISSFIPMTRHYNSGKGQVQGVMVTSDQKDIHAIQNNFKLATDDGKVALVQGKSGAVTPFPFMVDPKTNTLTVTTPSGTKTVTVLPDAAVENVKTSHVIDDITSAVTTGSLASIEQVITMEEKNGVLGYEISGQKKHNLLGFIPMKTDVTAFVSAENGQVVDTQTSLWGRILNKIAP